MRFKEIFINEEKVVWYNDEESLTRYGKKHSEMNVYYEDGKYFGYGKNEHGDVDARGFGGTADISKAAREMIKTFKLNSYSQGMAEFILTKAKEYSENDKDIKITQSMINNL